MPSGGFREGAGRKKGIPTKPVRVPLDIYHFVKMLSRAVRDNPDSYSHLFDSDRANYMIDCLGSNTPQKIIGASSRFKKKRKR